MKRTLPNFPAFPRITSLSLLPLVVLSVDWVLLYLGFFNKIKGISIVVVMNTLTSFHFPKRRTWQEHKYLFCLFSIPLNARLNTSIKDDSSVKFVLDHLKQMTSDWRGLICVWWRYGGLCKFSSTIVSKNKGPLNYGSLIFHWVSSRFSYCFIAAT